MNRSVLFRANSFVFLAVMLGLAAPMSADDNTLRVLCYNIHYGQGNDGKYDVERIAAVIDKMKPDLVALQEVDVGVKRSGRIHEARLIAKATGMDVRYGPTQHYEGGLFGNAVLTKLPITDVLIQPLPYTESTPERTTYPRGAIAVTVRAANDQKIRFISTHFQHNVPEDRVAEAAAVNKLFGTDDVPTILAGDMNASPTSEPIKILNRHWVNATDDPPSPTAPSSRPRTRIDYIFYRPATAFDVISASVIDEPMASDHCPVFAVLRLAPK